MSWQATDWALKYAPVPPKKYSAREVLFALASHAGPDGREAFPSVGTIAGYLLDEPVTTELLAEDDANGGTLRRRFENQKTTVKKALKLLREGGWIYYGSSPKITVIPEENRPRVYHLDFGLLKTNQPKRADEKGVAPQTPGGTPATGGQDRPRGSASAAPGGTPATSPVAQRPLGGGTPATQTVLQPSSNQKGETLSRGRSVPDAARALPERRKPSSHSPSPSHEPSRFEEWWALVPSAQKKKKVNARTAYPKAVKQAGDEQTVINGMRGFIESGQPFDMNASTWLNQAKWQDAPPPTEPALSDENYVDYTDVPLDDLEASADPEIQSQILDSLNQE